MRIGAANESLLASDESKVDCLVDSSGSMNLDENQTKTEEECIQEEQPDVISSNDMDAEHEQPKSSNNKHGGSKVPCSPCALFGSVLNYRFVKFLYKSPASLPLDKLR